MAHKLLEEELNETPKTTPVWKKFLPRNLGGKIGISLYLFRKEIFLGIAIADVEMERVVRKRFLPVNQKASVKVFRFD
jgi:hypothetical protein